MESVQVIFQFEEGGYAPINIHSLPPNSKMSEAIEKFKNKAYQLNFDNYEFYFNDKIVNQNSKVSHFRSTIIIISVRKRSYLTKCPVCEANTCFVKIEDYGLNFWGCPYGHRCTKTFSHYEESQKIHYDLIVCDRCQKTRKEVKEMFKCLTCSKNFQRSCYFCSECNAQFEEKNKDNKGVKHNVIKYDDKNYYCLDGSEYSCYCTTCGIDLCEKCEINHKNEKHITVKYDKISPKIESLKNVLKKIKVKLEESRSHIEQILKMIEGASSTFNKYYDICMDIIGKCESYNMKLKNFHIIKNLEFLENSNKIVLEDLNEFMKGDNSKKDYLKKCEKLFDIFYKERGNYGFSVGGDFGTQGNKSDFNKSSKGDSKNGKFYQ